MQGCGAPEVMYFLMCIFLKCFYPKCIFAKCTRLACLLSFASLFKEVSEGNLDCAILAQLSSAVDDSLIGKEN